MEISNKTLAWLVVAAIVVSIGGTMISLGRLGQAGTEGTGYATANASGTAGVTISTQTLLRFLVSSIDFSTGSVNATPPYQCNMSVNDTAGTVVQSSLCTGFPTTMAGGTFMLENNGNTLMNVSLNFSANSTNFIGGGVSPNPTPLFRFQVANNESSSCVSLNNTGWTDVAQQQWQLICTGLHWENNQDTLLIGIMVGIPADATGTKSVTVTAQGTG